MINIYRKARDNTFDQYIVSNGTNHIDIAIIGGSGITRESDRVSDGQLLDAFNEAIRRLEGLDVDPISQCSNCDGKGWYDASPN